ncbi:MAG: class I SAM-dependent methyltransferase [Spirochaetales bacterium]|nr:class I SAM-dependent methyltransferase [Spirochaetales bacterium]
MDNSVESLRAKGYGVIPPEQYLSDMEEDFIFIWKKISPFTMTSVERSYSLFKSVEYVVKNKISGDFVECGVWKGGSCMLIAMALKLFGDTDRKIYLYDTFEGMPEPTKEDVISWNGRSVLEKWEEDKSGSKDNFGSWAVGLKEVKANISSISYPENNFIFVPGDVELTLKEVKPDIIALLRLDTDWYASTVEELEILYPLLVEKGVIIIDDYGHFDGARKAVDEYFQNRIILLNRIDYTGRIGVKQS